MAVNLRKPTSEDLECFRECLAGDMFHKEQTVEDWQAAPGELMTFHDAKGNRVWVRIEKVLRISIQHDERSPQRYTALILSRGFHWLQGEARRNGFTEVIFESRAPRLIQFLHKLFGFMPVRGNFHVRT